MNLKKYEELKWIDEEEEDDSDLYGRPYYGKKDMYPEEEEDDDDPLGDESKYLLYLLRQMFHNSGIHCECDNSGGDILLTVFLTNKGNVSDILKAFEVVKKIKKDILAQYDSSYELWETKKGEPRLTFEFSVGDDLGDDNDFPW